MDKISQAYAEYLNTVVSTYVDATTKIMTASIALATQNAKVMPFSLFNNK